MGDALRVRLRFADDSRLRTRLVVQTAKQRKSRDDRSAYEFHTSKLQHGNCCCEFHSWKPCAELGQENLPEVVCHIEFLRFEQSQLMLAPFQLFHCVAGRDTDEPLVA